MVVGQTEAWGLVAELEAELTCALCNSLFVNPHTAPGCGHAFCRECIIATLEGPGISSSHCPTCRQPVWKKELAHNTKYANLVEAAKGVAGLRRQVTQGAPSAALEVGLAVQGQRPQSSACSPSATQSASVQRTATRSHCHDEPKELNPPSTNTLTGRMESLPSVLPERMRLPGTIVHLSKGSSQVAANDVERNDHSDEASPIRVDSVFSPSQVHCSLELATPCTCEQHDGSCEVPNAVAQPSPTLPHSSGIGETMHEGKEGPGTNAICMLRTPVDLSAGSMYQRKGGVACEQAQPLTATHIRESGVSGIAKVTPPPTKFTASGHPYSTLALCKSTVKKGTSESHVCDVARAPNTACALSMRATPSRELLWLQHPQEAERRDSVRSASAGSPISSFPVSSTQRACAESISETGSDAEIDCVPDSQPTEWVGVISPPPETVNCRIAKCSLVLSNVKRRRLSLRAAEVHILSPGVTESTLEP